MFKNCRFQLAFRLIGAFVFSLLLALVVDEYTLHLLILCCLFGMLALAQDVVFGRAGLLLLCVGAFFGIGAYASALMALRAGAPFWLCLLVAVFLTSICSFSIGVIARRVIGHYLAIVTLAFSVIVHQLMLNWVSLTNGALGLNNIPRPAKLNLDFLGSVDFADNRTYFIACVLALALTVEAVRQLLSKGTGAEWLAIREDELAAKSIGIDVRRSKVTAIITAGAIAGAAGSLYAHYHGLVAPEDLTFFQSINPLIMVIVGGSGTLAGPILGAALLTLLPEYLRALADYRWVLFGSALMLCMILFPKGLWGVVTLLWSRLLRTTVYARSTRL